MPSAPLLSTPPMDARQARGLAIVENGTSIRKEGRSSWFVPSQSKQGLEYEVRRFTISGCPTRFTCSCPDYERRGLTCKHAHAVQLLLGLQEAPKPKPAPAPLAQESAAAERPSCPSCACTQTVKVGTKAGKQYWRCRAPECGRKFVGERPTLGLKGDVRTVCMALDLYYKGVSLRKLAETLGDFHGVRVDHTTLYRWIRRFTRAIEAHAAKLVPATGENWNADEMKVKFTQDGGWKWLWHVMDRDTRYLLVSHVSAARFEEDAKLVFRQARTAAKKAPATVTTDGLHSYKAGVNKELRGAKHIAEIHLTNERANNNVVERVNNTTRERHKTARGVKKMDGIIARGSPVYYNHARPHTTLGGRTPAEAAGIGAPRRPGEPRWAALVRASHKEETA